MLANSSCALYRSHSVQIDYHSMWKVDVNTGVVSYPSTLKRYEAEHHGLDEDFWSRMRAAYDDRQVVELTMCLGSWLAFGRLNRVTGLDEVCSLPAHVPGARD